MKLFFRWQRLPTVLFRMVADAVMVNLAIITALAGRFIYYAQVEQFARGTDLRKLFAEFVLIYRNDAPLVTASFLAVAAASGFYTFGRAYRSKYKFLMVAQAVSIGFLIAGAAVYLMPGKLHLPRGAFLLAWLIALPLFTLSRLWSTLWSHVVTQDRTQNVTRAARRPKKVLVVGGAGYIGSALIPKLLNGGYEVRLLDVMLYGTEPIASFLNHPNFELMRNDFRHVDHMVAAMRQVDAVVHLGGIVGDPACSLDETLTVEVNLMATRMIAEVAKGSGVSRFVFASTCSVYGASDEILDERSVLRPLSLYAKSKLASERVLTQMTGDSFAPIILRFGTIYGLSGRTRFDLVVNLLTAQAVADGRVTVHGGDQWRPFLHVDDAAMSVMKALEAPIAAVRGEAFNVGTNDENYTISQVAQLVQKSVPAAEIVSMGEVTDKRNYRVNFRKIAESLNFKPNWTVPLGIEQVKTALASGRVKDYRDAQYSNVKFMVEERESSAVRAEKEWARELISQY